jgi:hypothetical protein
MENKLVREERVAFLQGREYERLSEQKTFTKKHVTEAYKAILARFPEHRKPDDGSGDEDSYNAGYNAAIDELAAIILDAFGATRF